jgi:hypothetical protein
VVVGLARLAPEVEKNEGREVHLFLPQRPQKGTGLYLFNFKQPFLPRFWVFFFRQGDIFYKNENKSIGIQRTSSKNVSEQVSKEVHVSTSFIFVLRFGTLLVTKRRKTQ